MKTRSQIDNKYKWDVDTLYATKQDFLKDLETLKKELKKVTEFKGKLKDKDTYLKSFKYFNKISGLEEKLAVYVNCKIDEDINDTTYKELENLLMSALIEYGRDSAYFSSEEKKLSKQYLLSCKADPRFKDFYHDIDQIIRVKQYALSESENKIVNEFSSFSDEFSEIFDNFDNADLKFEPIVVGNKKLPLTNANRFMYLLNPNREIRKQAVINCEKGYTNFVNTLSTNYIASVKRNWAGAKIVGFKSTLESHLYPDAISYKVYETLLNNVNKNLPLHYQYHKLRAKLLNLKDYNYYDKFLPLGKLTINYDYDKAYKTVSQALSVLGQDYIKVFDNAKNEGWIDIYPNEGKKKGAYSTAAYCHHPYVLLNYDKTYNDMSTLAHEMGHAMHSYYSNKNNTINNAQYTIFLAEVASTVNEFLLNKYLYDHAKTKDEKLFLLNELLTHFSTTIFRQAQFSEFEDYAHKLVENDQPITKDILNAKYAELNDKYYKIKNINKVVPTEWLRVPHFFTPYYVYKYCIGFVSAVCIGTRILNHEKGAVESYINFLKDGCRHYSVETLNIAGVDLLSNKPYEMAFNEMKWAISEIQKLTKE